MKGLEGDERNVLLTLARMWRTSVTGEFVPKDLAAAWAAPQHSRDAAGVQEQARQAYLSGAGQNWKYSPHEIQRVADELHRQVLAVLG